MKLKMRRDQKQTAMSKEAVFSINIEAELSSNEHKLADQYGLRNELVYENEVFGTKIKFMDLIGGKHFESKNLHEIRGMEHDIRKACEGLADYMRVATSYDGSEDVLEIPETAE